MITLLHGPEELVRAEHLAQIRAALGPAELADLSTTWLDGRKTPVAEVCYHGDVMPFLTPRRLVIVDGLLSRLSKGGRGGKKGRSEAGSEAQAVEETVDAPAIAAERRRLLAYLPDLPDTTDLVLIEAEEMSLSDPVVKLLGELAKGGRAAIVPCQAPPVAELPAWITRRAEAKGARIDRAAAQDLATFVGRNLRLLDNELEKLAAYCGGARPITPKDVRLLVPYAQEANIFDMVDAMGRRDQATALRLLRGLERDGAAPLYLLSMIVRQFRILIQVSDLMGQNLDKEAIARQIGLHPYPTQKAMQQSRLWRPEDLAAVYDRLLETDLAIKTGKLPDDLALDLLVVELSQASSGADGKLLGLRAL